MPSPGRASLVLISLASLGLGLLSHGRPSHPQSSFDPASPLNQTLRQGQKYVPGEVIVRFKPGATHEGKLALHAAVRGQVVGESKLVEDLQVVRLGEPAAMEEAIVAYRRNPDVLYAEPNYILRASTVPSDPSF